MLVFILKEREIYGLFHFLLVHPADDKPLSMEGVRANFKSSVCPGDKPERLVILRICQKSPCSNLSIVQGLRQEIRFRYVQGG